MTKKVQNIILFIIALIGVNFSALFAQSLNGEKIQVSAQSLTVLKFNSPVTRYDFGTRDNYTCQVRDIDNSLVIKTIGENPISTNLYVNEGKRAHLFVIEFLKTIDINKVKLFYDFSNLKELKKHIESQEQNNNSNGNEGAIAAILKPDESKMSRSEKKEAEKKEKEAKEAEQKRIVEIAQYEANKKAVADKLLTDASKAKNDSVSAIADAKAAELEKKQRAITLGQELEKTKQEAAQALKKQQDLEAQIAKAEKAAKLQKAIDDAKSVQDSINLIKAQKAAAEKVAKAERDAKMQKAIDDAKAAQELVDAKLAEKAAAEKVAKAERDAKLQKAIADEKARLDSINTVKAQKAEDEKLALAAKTAEQKKALEDAMIKAEAERRVKAEYAEKDRIAAAAKKAADLEAIKQAAAEAKAIQDKKDEDARIARAEKAAKIQKELDDAKIAAEAAKVIKAQKVEEEKIARAEKAAQVQKDINDAKAAAAAAKALKAQKEEEARLAAIEKQKHDLEEAKAAAEAKKMALNAQANHKKRVADSIAAAPRTYSHIELFKKYPRFLFEAPPAGQTTAVDFVNEQDTTENGKLSREMLAQKTVFDLSSDSSEDGIHFTLEDMNFRGVNCYMKLHIYNPTPNDYLVGQINLKWYRGLDTTMIKLYPVYVTGFPPMPPKTNTTIIYATRAGNVQDIDQLVLTMGDRLKQISLEMVIPTELYLKELNSNK